MKDFCQHQEVFFMEAKFRFTFSVHHIVKIKFSILFVQVRDFSIDLHRIASKIPCRLTLCCHDKRVGMLGRVCPHVTTYSANTIYITMIRSIIEYCSGVWACCGEVNNGNLERLQNRAARTVAQTPSSSSALSYLKWQSLNSRRNNNIFKLVKKSLNGECPQYFMNYFSFNKDVILRTTRQSNLLHLPSVQTETAKRAFYYHGCTVFNNFTL